MVCVTDDGEDNSEEKGEAANNLASAAGGMDVIFQRAEDGSKSMLKKNMLKERQSKMFLKCHC